MFSTRVAILAQEATQEVSEKKDLYPGTGRAHPCRVLPSPSSSSSSGSGCCRSSTCFSRSGAQQIQGQIEQADETRKQAEQELADYRVQLANARDEGNRIIEEARKTAEQLRRDIQASAEQEAQSTVVRAQEEIRAERDRVFNELRAQVGEIAVELAGRVSGSRSTSVPTSR